MTIASYGSFGQDALRPKADVQAELNNLTTAMANFRVAVQAWQHPMQKVVLGMIDLAIGTGRSAQNYLAGTVWNRQLEQGAMAAMAKARQHYSAAAVTSASVRGPQAEGVWLPTPAPIGVTPAGGEAALLAPTTGISPGTWLAVAAVAGLVVWGLARRR